jgi:hypothetical protein
MVIFYMLSKYFLFLVCFSLFACSGNNSSSKTTPDNTFKQFSGVVNNASVYGATVFVIPIGDHGLPRLNEDDDTDSISLVSNDKGRYGVLLKTSEEGVHIVSAVAPNADTESLVQVEPAKMQCQVTDGCLVLGQIVAFGSTYPMPANFQWSAGVEFISDGQFVVINPITEMATLLGFSTYVNSPDDTGVSVGTIAKPGHYSSYGIVKGNSQTADLLGVSDIISIEPIDLFNLHDISASDSISLQDSIRYGALVAGWQKLELDYDNSIVEGDFNFQQQVIFEYIGNQGQFYQAEPLDNQVLSMKAWYGAAVSNLIAARDFHTSLSRAVPKEINLVITRMQEEIAIFKNGELTAAKATIPSEVSASYADAITKTKAMVNYLSDLRNNFANEEFRSNVQLASTLVTDEMTRLSPSFDVLMPNLLSVKNYYVSCAHQACDVGSPWHSPNNIYSSSSKTLTINSSGATLTLSQAKAFDDEEPESTALSHTHDLLIAGTLIVDGLQIDISDFTPEEGGAIESRMRFIFSEALSELPLEPALVVGGKGARVDETLIPDVIELILPVFSLFENSAKGTEKELTLSGAFRAKLVANLSADDFLENIDIKDKLGKRYNLSNVDATLKLVGANEGVLADNSELRDNAIISLNAVASDAFAGLGNLAAYYPDTVLPTFESFFKPREGFSVGTVSSAPLVVSRRGVMNFPKLDSEGLESGTEVVAVDYLELDYEVGGLERYVVYPKISGDDKFWGFVCSASAADEAELTDPNWTKVEIDAEGNTTTRVLLSCNIRDKFEGESTPDSLINSIYAIDKNLVNLREYNGQGIYRIGYDTEAAIPAEKDADGKEVRVLSAFSQGEDSHLGEVEEAIVLGVDSMRLQIKPEFVNSAGTGFLPEAAVDVTLIWRKHDVIDANVFLSFNADQNFNNPDGSGLPYIGVGTDVESYSVAYRKTEDGDELGRFTFAWAGVHFVDGPIDGEKVMQRTSDDNLKEGVVAGVGSNVDYRSYSKREKENLGLSDDDIDQLEKNTCGFFERGKKTEAGENCSAVAYLTFRGFVTGTLREESDGSYVIRYIDGSWQVLGVK